MSYSLNKLSGIYQIKNTINNKIYIGHSINITFRWYYHLNNLIKNIHPNNKLQNDFNKYGVVAFEFSILELVDGKTNLIKREQEYLDKINFDDNYNLVNSIANKNNEPQIDDFINYINDKWLVPKGITDKNELNKYKIYKEEDKQNIINMAIECKLLKLYPSRITFLKVISFMQNSLGYAIENQRGMINKEMYTYKLIVDFNEEKIDYSALG